jgi:hypothetical protein
MGPTSSQGDSTLTPELGRRIDAICDRFEAACRAGERPCVADYARDIPEAGRAYLLRELRAIAAAYLRQDGGRGQAAVPPLSGFAFLRRLGGGGFGEVWLATDLNLRQERAVKLLSRERYSALDLDLLAEEARTMAALPRHRNRVQVHALFPGIPTCFLVMEYVSGGSLKELAPRENPLPWERAVRYVADIADGLGDVHAAGILHRDIKPENVLWDRRADEALLADFGIAARAGQARGIAGTPGYIAPELDGGSASAKSDVFSLGATLFRLVTGRAPFPTANWMASVSAALAGLSDLAGLERVPGAVRDVIVCGLRPEPAQRPDLAEFSARLRGAHLQGLADKLAQAARGTAVRVHVSVSAADEGELVFRPVPCQVARSEPAKDRNMVPEPAPVAAVRTGQLVRLEVAADADGYLTVLNLGSSGQLRVLFPNPVALDNRIRPGRPHTLTVKLTPPPGTDRAAVIWTRLPSALSLAEWRQCIEAGKPAVLPPPESSRGMDLVLHQAGEQPADAWTAAVVAIAHASP